MQANTASHRGWLNLWLLWACQQKNLCSRTPQLSFTRCKTNLIMLQIFDSVVGHIDSYPGWQGSWGLWWACRLGVCSSATHFAKLSSPYHSTWNSARVCPQELSCPGGAGISSEACQGSLPRITCHPANDQWSGHKGPSLTCELGKSLRTYFPNSLKLMGEPP